MANNKLESHKAAVQQWFNAFDERDFAKLQQVTEQHFYEQTVAMLKWVNETFSDHHLSIQELVAEDNRVVVRVHSKGQHTGEFMGVSGTGRRWEGNEGAMLFYFEKERIVNVWQLWDIPSHLQKLGLKMTVSMA